MRITWLLALLFSSAITHSQSEDTAQRIYTSSQDSVFLVYLNDNSGSPTALGSAFLIAHRTLVTNAHVVDAGQPVLAVGPVRLPLHVLKVDRINDLAILTVDVDLTSNPLPLATGLVTPGEQIFAIGNPEGLEKTISQGIVSGLRKKDERNLIQITSPISHGSSGGPILNSKGEVVGVAVGMLEDGQNLNFAVPVSYVKSILESKNNSPSPVDLRHDMAEVHSILNDRGTYSSEDDSDYQKKTKRLRELADELVTQAKSVDDLRDLACIGTNEGELSDDGIQAARMLLQRVSTSENRTLLAYVLYDRAQTEQYTAEFAKKDSSEMTSALSAHAKFFSEAEQNAKDAIRFAKGNDLLVASYVLGNIMNDEKNYVDAIPLHTVVATKKVMMCGADLSKSAMRLLIDENNNANRPNDSEKWFKYYASLYEPYAYEWDAEGDRRVAASDASSAADAYEKAGTSSYYAYDYCYAAPIAEALPNQEDRVLADGRKCVESSVNANSNNKNYYKTQLPIVYRVMAEVLEQRGVYQQALEYVKESLNTEPDNARSLDIEADIFSDLDRYTECIAAETAAITASDGKYPWMQFRLGSCYFSTGNWSKAETSFRLAAEADKSDAASAYNLGLCLSRQGFDGDARQWFREALNRKPNEELKTKILRALQ